MGVSDWLRERALRLAEQRLGDDATAASRALSVRQNEYGFDPFGFHRDHLQLAAPLAALLHRKYFRTEVFNIDRVPAGRVILCANHSGQLPFDGVMITCAMLFDHQPPRLSRSMVEKFVPTLPFASYLFSRWGQITGTPENCRRLLEDDEAILVFPEGVKGISKPFTKRYQLQDFGTGFMRLALASGAPIVPIAVIGAEEQAPAVNLPRLARLLGAPAFPVSPIPPFLPLVPLPVRYRLYFGEPMTFTGDPDDDDTELQEQADLVRRTIQSMVQVGLAERKHVFW
jgi:1-acyl-sn-glycerol-3-phosphate acyltransferase